MAPRPGVQAPGKKDRNLGVPVSQGRCHQLHGGPAQTAVTALPDLEREAADHQPLPRLPELLSGLVVKQEMDGPDLVRVEAAGVLDGARRGQVQTVHEHQDDMAAQYGQLGGFGCSLFQLLRLQAVLAVQPYESHRQDGEQDHHRPRSLGELGHDQDADHDKGQDRRAGVDGQLVLPALRPVEQVVLAHARPGHGEPREHSYGVDGHQ